MRDYQTQKNQQFEYNKQKYNELYSNKKRKYTKNDIKNIKQYILTTPHNNIPKHKKRKLNTNSIDIKTIKDSPTVMLSQKFDIMNNNDVHLDNNDIQTRCKVVRESKSKKERKEFVLKVKCMLNNNEYKIFRDICQNLSKIDTNNGNLNEFDNIIVRKLCELFLKYNEFKMLLKFERFIPDKYTKFYVERIWYYKKNGLHNSNNDTNMIILNENPNKTNTNISNMDITTRNLLHPELMQSKKKKDKKKVKRNTGFEALLKTIFNEMELKQFNILAKQWSSIDKKNIELELNKNNGILSQIANMFVDVCKNDNGKFNVKRLSILIKGFDAYVPREYRKGFHKIFSNHEYLKIKLRNKS